MGPVVKKRLRFASLTQVTQRFARGRAGRPAPAAPEPAAEPAASAVAEAGEVEARFGVIDLADLRASLGPRWPALERRVRAVAEAVIERHLVRGDVFDRKDDGTYVLLFARMTKAQADFKCGVISKEIARKLLGSEAVGDGRQGPIAENLRADEAYVFDDFEAVRPPAAAPALADHVDTVVAPIGPADRPAAPLRPQQARGLRGSTAVPIDHAPRPRPPIRWLYTPVWDAEQHSLVRFRLTSGDRLAAAAAPLGASTYGVDLRTVSKALDDTVRMGAEGRRRSMIPVIHVSSLTVAWRRDQLIELIGHAPRPVRRLLRLEVFMPRFAVTEPLLRFAEALAAIEVRLAVGVPLEGIGALQPAGLPLAAVSVEVAEDSPAMLRRLRDFARRCDELGLRSAAHGLDSGGLLGGALAGGVRFVSGAAVHPGGSDLADLCVEPRDLEQALLARGPV
jgi:hypothetical protein